MTDTKYELPATIEEIVHRPELTTEEEKLARAFFDGASYCMWFIGRKYPYYNHYFEQCKTEGKEPTIAGHICEDMHGIGQEYGRGWRFRLIEYWKNENANKWRDEEEKNEWKHKNDKEVI